MEPVKTFDPSEYLDSPEVIAAYLSQIIEDGDMEEFYEAIGDVAKARGMTAIANATGLGRESLYKSFAPGGNPKFSTVAKVMAALGFSIHFDPLNGQSATSA